MAEQGLFSSNSSFYLIQNIPASLHSAELRAFFSRVVEAGVFLCFHYKHRPEHLRRDEAETPQAHTATSSSSDTPTKCCVVVLKAGVEEERTFIKSYSNKNWLDSNGDTLYARAHIQTLTVVSDSAMSVQTPSTIQWSDLQPLPELNPPSVMPRGNVGTPLSIFMTLIRSCKLPGHVIKKLRLEFPKTRSTRRYGAVKLDYSDYDNQIDSGECRVERGQQKREDDKNSDESDTIPSDDDHDAEEWERYEALHSDVDKQGRTKERLYEEELEVVWEKGGSGLVFYTDSAYWQEQEGDFDEQCSKEDDWDVDVGVYYGCEGSRDAVALREMTQEQRLRDGVDTEGESWSTVAGFEKHTKGFGSRVLRQSGWRVGQGVGVANQGMSSPLEVEGQLPSVKKGLGYRGEKLDRQNRKRPLTRDVLISTVYDRPNEKEDTVLRSAPVGTLKYREFRTGGLLNPNHQQ